MDSRQRSNFLPKLLDVLWLSPWPGDKKPCHSKENTIKERD
jgi:hypothetical protein